MIGSAGMGFGASDIEQIVDERVYAVDDDQQNDRRDDRARCGNADGAGAGLRLQAAQAADAGDQDREHRRLGEPREQVLDVDQTVDLVQESADRNIEADHGQRAAEDADQVGEDAQQRHHQQGSDDAGDDKEADRIEAHGGQRVELFVDLHGSDFCREGRAGTPGEQDPGHQRPELAQYRESDQVRNEDLGAELPHRYRGLERENDAEQERYQRHDRQRVDADLLAGVPDVLPANAVRLGD